MIKYKLIKTDGEDFVIRRLSDSASIPCDGRNRDFMEFLESVREEGLEIVEGADKEHPGYQELRAAAYPSVVDQMDVLYHLGAAEWKKAIKAIKEQYPSSIVAHTTIEPLPQWCLDIEGEGRP